jgi:RHS repeat-associated protein
VRTVASPGDDGEVTFTFGDHLGSSSTVWQAGELGDTDPGVTSYQRYYPYGEPRDTYNPNLPTDHTFTGQITDGLLDDGGTGLMYYGARYYDPQVGRFAAADTIVPNPSNPQDLNRYTYVRGNPINGVDPSGHDEFEGLDPEEIGGVRQCNSPRCLDNPAEGHALEVVGVDSTDPATAGGTTTNTGASIVATLVSVLAQNAIEDLLADPIVDSEQFQLWLEVAAMFQSGEMSLDNMAPDARLFLYRVSGPNGGDGYYWTPIMPMSVELTEAGRYYGMAGISVENPGTTLFVIWVEVAGITYIGLSPPARDRPKGRGNTGGLPEVIVPNGIDNPYVINWGPKIEQGSSMSYVRTG